MEDVLYGVSYVLSTLFELYVIAKCLKMFLGKASVAKRYEAAAYAARFILCTLQYIYMPFGLLNILVGFLTLFIISLCYGGGWLKKLVTVVMMLMSLFAAEAVVAGIIGLSNVDIMAEGHNGDAFSFIGISIVLGIIYEIIRTFKNINNELQMPVGFSVAILVISIIIFSMEMTIFMQNNISMSLKILSVMCMLMVLLLIVYLYDSISKNYTEKMQSKIMELEKNYYYKQAELLYSKGKELSDFRHDMNNHLYSIASLIGDTNEEAKGYLEKLTHKIEKTRMFSNTGNVALDSVINYKLSDAEEEENISVSSDIAIPGHISEGIEDMVTILGNLLDNAIEAAKNIENGYIKIRMKYKTGVLFINVTNNYDGVIKSRHGKLLTKKADKAFHGIGLQSVESAVNEHDGTVDIWYDDKEFTVKVMLYIVIE